jgi:hypothetical protein
LAEEFGWDKNQRQEKKRAGSHSMVPMALNPADFRATMERNSGRRV